jgi:hypothetical protein
MHPGSISNVVCDILTVPETFLQFGFILGLLQALDFI